MTPTLALLLIAAADPLPVAHRGLLRHAPENTRPAFAACLDLRLGFELDVQRTKDGHLVVLHDLTLDRTTNLVGKVNDLTLAEVRTADAGKRFHPAFAGEPVPTLAEVFELAAKHPGGPALIALDLKDPATIPGVAKLVAEHKLTDKVVCIGTTISDPAVRKAIKAADPKLPTATLSQTSDDFAAAVKDVLSSWVYVRFVPTAEQVTAAHAAGKKVLAAGPMFVKAEGDVWVKTAAAGVDAILTDFPLELRHAVTPTP